MKMIMNENVVAPRANPHRGEVVAVIDGRARPLRLTLGALAALEAALDPPDLTALLERFERGRPTARDVAGVIAAGLAGAGQQLAPDQDAADALPGGLPEAYALAAKLLAAAFGAGSSGGAPDATDDATADGR